MPKIPPSLASFGRRSQGAFFRTAPFVAKVGAVTGGGFILAHAGERVIETTGNAFNPPAQSIAVDTDPTRPGPESHFIFDPKTGGSQTFGQPATDKGNPQRSQDRNTTALMALGAAALVAVVLATRK